MISDRMISLMIIVVMCFMACSSNTSDSTNIVSMTSDLGFEERWTCSENRQITINQQNGKKIIVTSDHIDYKPSWSPSGDQLTFFRFINKGRGFHTWRTKICVVNIDGTGLRELTSGNYPDFNPTWTRDGSNMIIFNRHAREPGWKCQIFMMAPDGKIDEHELISHPSNDYYEFARSTLKDGRIFVDRFGSDFAKSFLLTPKPGNVGIYEEVQRPTEKLWHKLSVSPDETKVAYMLDNDRKLYTYKDAVIAIADFDKANLKVENQIVITDMEPKNIYEYPRWSRDGKYVIYDSNKSGKFQIYAYHLEKELTARISPDEKSNYQFGNCEKLPK